MEGGFASHEIIRPKENQEVKYYKDGLEVSAHVANLRQNLLDEAIQAGMDSNMQAKVAETSIFFDRKNYFDHLASVHKGYLDESRLKGVTSHIGKDWFTKGLMLAENFLPVATILDSPQNPTVYIDMETLADYTSAHNKPNDVSQNLQQELGKIWVGSSDHLLKLFDAKYHRNHRLKAAGKTVGKWAAAGTLGGAQFWALHNISALLLGFPVRMKAGGVMVDLAHKGYDKLSKTPYLQRIFPQNEEITQDEIDKASSLFTVKKEKLSPSPNYTPLIVPAPLR